MATKKQKREAGLAKRASFMAQEKERGLAAQKADQQQRAADEQAMAIQAAEVNVRHRRIINAAMLAFLLRDPSTDNQ